MSSSNKRRSPLRKAGQRITAVLAAATLCAGSAVPIAPAAAADYPPDWTAPTNTADVETVDVEMFAQPSLQTGYSYTAGETITANPGRWQEGATLSYFWLLDGRTIYGEHGLSLKLLPEHTWSTLQFGVTASLEGRGTVLEFSAQTLQIKPLPVQNFTAPTISGDLVPGGILTLDPGTWTEGAEFSVQWLRNGEPSWYHYGNIQHVTEDDLGATFSAVVTADVPWLSPLSASTNITGPVVEAEVAVEGINIPGNMLRAAPGAWAQGKDVYYEWLIDGVPNGYTGQEYYPSDDEGGHEISVLARAGFSISATSKPMALQPVIQNYEEPTIEGETVEGRTLTAVPGHWTEGTQFSYQWMRDGVAIPGATGATYRLVRADSGAANMSVDITGTREDFVPLTRTGWSGPVTSDYVEIFEEAVVSGEPHLGRTLSVQPGVWTEGTTFTYQWYRNHDTPIPGATSSTYKQTRDDLNTTVDVVVRGTLPDHKSMISRAGINRWVTVAEVANTKAPSIIGPPVLGTYLYADPGTWSDGANLEYQWYADGQGIMYAESNRLLMSDKYIGTQLSVRITATLADHKTTSVYSARSAVVAAPPVSNTKAPVLTGTAVRGQTLTVTPGVWTDKATLSYEWMRGDTTISGANGTAYTLGAEDVGKRISVKVTGSKSQHMNLTVATPASAVIVNPQLSALPPTVSGSPLQGSTLTALPGAWPAKTFFAYQWMRNSTPVKDATTSTYKLTAADAGARMSVKITGSLTGYVSATATSAQTAAVTAPVITAPASVSITGNAFQGQQLKVAAGTWTSGAQLGFQWYADGAVVSGATGTSLLLGPAQTGKKITVKVTGILDGTAAVSRTSAQTTAVGMYEVKNTSKPALSGSAVVGSTMKASAGTWTADTALTYQWLRAGTPIKGAVASTYVVTAADLGKQLSAAVSGTKADHKPLTVSTSASAAVIQPAVLNTVKPAVTGSAIQGQTLASAAGTWTKGAVLSFQWKRDGQSIEGARSGSYKLTAADFGKSITVAVTGTLAGHTSTVASSNPTAKVTRASVVNTVKPVIIGTMVAGQTLKASAGTWTMGAVLTYQWKANGANIAGATAGTYKLTDTEFGKTITVTVTGTLADHNPASATSSATAKVARPAVLNTAVPKVAGSPVQGQTLKASAGTWTKGAKLSHQWKANGKDIARATAGSYKLTAADFGKTITVAVTGTLAGHTPATAVSAPTSKVTRTTVANTVKPVISGTMVAGQTLKVSSGTWTKGAKLSYQWKANGKDIARATSGSYKLASADAGKKISVAVTGTLTDHNPVTVTVQAASAATLPSVANTVKPAVTGSAVSGQTLKVTAGSWTKGAKLTYQWMRSGQPIKGATKPSYTAVAADAGQRLSVKVTGTLANHKPTSVTTANTAAVKLPAVTVTGTPSISGTAKTGSTLKVSSPGKWTAGTKLTYQWMRNGTVIKGAAAPSYKLAAADKGTTITVKVTGTMTGHTPASAVSKKTAAVR